MTDLIGHFHFIRPWVLLALLPLAGLLALLWRQKKNATGWRDIIDSSLLVHLLDGQSRSGNHRLLAGLGLIWLIATLALAGPAWEKRPSPVQRQADALIVVLDLSPSMVVEDVTPSRMVQARLKIAELLKRREEGETALIAYAGDAHVVTPLTVDTETITTLLPTLSPGIMPLPGSNTEAGIGQAVEMLQQAGMEQGRILLITDGVVPRAEPGIAKALKGTRYSLSILGIGTDEGAPIPSGRGDFVRNNGNVVISRLDSDYLQELANKHGGRYSDSHYDGRDLEHLLPPASSLTGEHRDTEQTIDQWYDRGPWLVLLLLPLLLYCFRRGVVLGLWLLPAALVLSPSAEAINLDNLWLTPDQQGARALDEGDADTALERFEDPAWKGTAAYRAGDFDSAAEYFSQLDTASAHYNRGNALARSGELDEALAAYQQALDRDPQLTDAADNKALVEQLKQQQEQQQQNQGDGEEGQQSGEDSEGKGSSADNQSDGDQNDGEQQDADSGSEGESDPTAGRNQGDNQDTGSTDNTDPSEGEDTPPPGDTRDGESDNDSQTGDTPAAADDSEPADEADQESQATAEQAESTDKEGQEQRDAMTFDPSDQEAQQALEQWLRQVPDDPAGLLRNKFRYQYQRRTDDRIEQKLNPFNSDEQRW